MNASGNYQRGVTIRQFLNSCGGGNNSKYRKERCLKNEKEASNIILSHDHDDSCAVIARHG